MDATALATIILYPISCYWVGGFAKDKLTYPVAVAFFITPILAIIIFPLLDTKEPVNQFTAVKMDNPPPPPKKEFRPIENGVEKPTVCPHCDLIFREYSHYCPRCFRDADGYTIRENYNRFNYPNSYQSSRN